MHRSQELIASFLWVENPQTLPLKSSHLIKLSSWMLMRLILTTTLLLLMTSVSGAASEVQSASQKGERIVQFIGGQTTIISKDGVDYVVVKDQQGNVMAESVCDSATFDDYFGLFSKLKVALIQGDRQSVLGLVAYPFRVNAETPLIFQNEASLLKSYDKVFTPSVLAKIQKAEPAIVFCRDEQAMFGNGMIWARRSNSGVAATVVNP
jgi:hypothetical protein